MDIKKGSNEMQKDKLPKNSLRKVGGVIMWGIFPISFSVVQMLFV